MDSQIAINDQNNRSTEITNDSESFGEVSMPDHQVNNNQYSLVNNDDEISEDPFVRSRPEQPDLESGPHQESRRINEFNGFPIIGGA